MNEKPQINLLKILLPLAIFSLLLYGSLHFIDNKPLEFETLAIILLTIISFFYLVNYKLLYIKNRKGIFAILVIVIIAFGFKMYVLIPIKGLKHVLSGYGILLGGFIFTSVVFILRHLRLKLLEAVEFFIDKEKYSLGEAINYSVEINPVKSVNFKKLQIRLVMSENVFSQRKVVDKVVYEHKETLREESTISEYTKINGMIEIPVESMCTVYGLYSSIFWYIQLILFDKSGSYENTKLIEVKPEILVRLNRNE